MFPLRDSYNITNFAWNYYYKPADDDRIHIFSMTRIVNELLANNYNRASQHDCDVIRRNMEILRNERKENVAKKNEVLDAIRQLR
jgi:hypothetical protein